MAGGSAGIGAEVDLRGVRGLTEADAAERLRREGPNEIPAAKRRSLPALALHVVREPMILLLAGCAAIYLLLGDPADALVLLASVLVVICIALYQHRKTERALDALKRLSSPRALVIRDGRQRRIAGREVVRGDLILLSEGDRVAADGILLQCESLTVDESLLTGESGPVRKGRAEPVAARPGQEETVTSLVYSGSLVGSGQGLMEVRATGIRTEIGKIGRTLQSLETEETGLERQIARFVRLFAAVGLSLCALVALLYGMARQDWLEGALAGLALAMSMMPEEFPVILTIFLALGAWRISRRNVLTRRTPVIEALGAATVLCVDKTGTLTQNRMSVSALWADGRAHDLEARRGEPLPAELRTLVRFALLASRPSPFDPMEQSIQALGETCLPADGPGRDGWTLAREYPLHPGLMAMTRVWETREGGDRVIAAKGAPEAITSLCRIDPERLHSVQQAGADLARRGYRILGVAQAASSPGPLPGDPGGFDFEFLGLLGLADPVRPGVPEALKECYRAGIRTVMITGDYPGTALKIAEHIGLFPRDAVLTGPELDAMEDSELVRRVRAVNLFARVVPDQKLRIVNALKARGEVIAMTGDGVNDAPALKAAHIGIAMGGRGTDVAREAASLVLLDDDFSSIVRVVRLGRRIDDNIRKAMSYVLSIHVPIAGLSLIPVLLRWPLILLPVHIAFLELIIDPACSIAFEAEPEEDDVMDRPPRRPGEPLFGRRTIRVGLLQGTLALLLVLGALGFAAYRGYGEDRSRTLAFSTLMVTNLGLILANRSLSPTTRRTLRAKNGALWWVVGGAVLALLLTLALPPLRTVLRFAVPSPADVAAIAGAGAACLVGLEVLKAAGCRLRPGVHGISPNVDTHGGRG